jgi:hypothetical protein
MLMKVQWYIGYAVGKNALPLKVRIDELIVTFQV